MPPSNLPPANESPAIELPAPDPRWADWSAGPSPGPRRTRVLIGVLIGAVVLALLVTAGVVAFRVARDPARLTRGAATPQAAVQGFLDALANDHADQALSFEAAAVPHNRTSSPTPSSPEPTGTTRSPRSWSAPVRPRRRRNDGTASRPVTRSAPGQPPPPSPCTRARPNRLDHRQTTIQLDPSALLKDKIPLLLAGVAVVGHVDRAVSGHLPGQHRAESARLGCRPSADGGRFRLRRQRQDHADPRITDDGRKDAATAVTKAATRA